MGRGGECFSPQAYESAVGYWATAINAELAEQRRLSKLAAEALVLATYDPNLDPRVSEAAPVEAATEQAEAHTEASAAARAVRFTAAEAQAEAGGATPQISEAGGAGGAGGATPLTKQSSKPPSTSEGPKLLEASKSISRFGLLTLTPTLTLTLTLSLTLNPKP